MPIYLYLPQDAPVVMAHWTEMFEGAPNGVDRLSFYHQSDKFVVDLICTSDAAYEAVEAAYQEYEASNG